MYHYSAQKLSYFIIIIIIKWVNMAFSFNPTGFNLNTSYKLFLKDEKLPSINYNDRI